jgi:hypothetical protein
VVITAGPHIETVITPITLRSQPDLAEHDDHAVFTHGWLHTASVVTTSSGVVERGQRAGSQLMTCDIA